VLSGSKALMLAQQHAWLTETTGAPAASSCHWWSCQWPLAAGAAQVQPVCPDLHHTSVRTAPHAAPTTSTPHIHPLTTVPPLPAQLLWSVGPSAFLLASIIMTTTLYHLDKFDHKTLADMGHEAQERTASRELTAAAQVGAGWELGGGGAWCSGV
jgi:hypothetical protein